MPNTTNKDDELRQLVHVIQNAATVYDAMQFIKQYGIQIENELTDNEKKVWLYKEDFEKRLLQERIAAQLEEIPFIHNMHETAKSLLEDGSGDFVRVQDLEKRLSDWIAELTALKDKQEGNR